MSWEAVRQEFPTLQKCTYLNTATMGQIPNRSQAELSRHFAERNDAPLRDFMSWFDDLDAIRALVGKLIGCRADDIAFIQNASAALSLMMSGIDWKPGDQILTMDGEFPNQINYAAHLANKGVELVIASCGELLEYLTERTRLVAISTVSYSNGYLAPAAQIGKILRQRGILFYLDGTQSVGALPIDLQQVQPDIFAVHAYKWMLSPHGAAFMYVSPGFRPHLDPAVIGWRSDRSWRSVNSLNQGAPAFSETAEKYEGGMPNFSAIYALGESVRMMLELGPDRIQKRVLELAAHVKLAVEAAGGAIMYEGSSVVAARFPGRETSALALQLKEHEVIVAARGGNLRVSSHFYNNEEDIRRFSETLQRLM